MSNKEIIIVTISLGNDGAERVLTELANEWVKNGYKVSVVQTGKGNYGCAYTLSDNIEVINIKAKSRLKAIRYFQEISKLQKILKQHKKATALSFIVSSIFILAMCKPFVHNKIVVSERNNPRRCPQGILQKKLRDLSFFIADACVFQTEEAMHMFPKGVQKKGYIIPNPINANLPEIFSGERRKAIVTASRLHKQKNLPMLIAAFELFSKEYPEYVLEIYGQGEEENSLKALIHQKQLENKVVIPGFVENVHEMMNTATMYVSSSDYEGISNSMLEALGMGLPTIVTDCPVGGSRMIIQNNINGILIPVGDHIAMYRAMKKVAGDGSFASMLSNNAKEIKELLPIKKVSELWIKQVL